MALPEFVVLADGVEIGRGRVSAAYNGWLGAIPEGSADYERFAFDAGPDHPDHVEIRFVNDGCDPVTRRAVNLAIDRIEVGGSTYQAEEDGWFVAQNPNDSKQDGPRETLFEEGSLHFFDLG